MRTTTILAVPLLVLISAALTTTVPANLQDSAQAGVAGAPPGVAAGTYLRVDQEAEYYLVQEARGPWIRVLRRDPENLRSVGTRELYEAPYVWMNLAVMRSYEIYVRHK